MRIKFLPFAWKGFVCLRKDAKARFIRRIDSRTPEQFLPVSNGRREESQTDEGRRRSSEKFISYYVATIHSYLSRRFFSLLGEGWGEGGGEEGGREETPRGMAIATPIIGCLQLPARFLREWEREKERERGRGEPVGCENGERLLYETGSSLSLKKNPTADRIVGE